MLSPIIEGNDDKQISLFYRYLKPSATSLLKLVKNNKYSSEFAYICKNIEQFVQQTIQNNKIGDCFACRNRFTIKRKTSNINFLKCFVIDVDDDIDNVKSQKFEQLCKDSKIYIEAKAESRDKGGYHYYIPYQQTVITNANREQMIKVSNNFRDWLIQEKNLDIDPRVFDLPRLIRIWGTLNHKRKSMCKLLYLHSASPEQIQHNTDFINSITSKSFPKLPSSTSVITSCPLVEFVRHTKLTKESTEKNDKLLKNVAIFLFTILGEDGLSIGREIAILQEHNPAEMDGWFDKCRSGELKNFSCGEIKNWLEAYYPDLLPTACNKCRLSNRNKVDYTSGNETWNQLKKQAREQSRLLINKNILVKGIIAPSITQTKQDIVIFRNYIDDNDENIQDPKSLIVFLDEKQPKGAKWLEQYSLSAEFFVYELKEEGVSYTLLSEKELDYGEYYVHGVAVKLQDQLLVGNYGKVSSKKKLLFLHNAKPTISKIKNHEELFKTAPDWSSKKLSNFLFNIKNKKLNKSFSYHQPENVTALLFSFLFSTNEDYPLHLALYGSQDSGKSTIISSMLSNFNEPYVLIDGSNTTLKGIVPSFSGSVPKIGVILESKRICAIDEFFRVIKTEEDNDKISVLNNFLLHTEYSNKTGKGDINCIMRSKLFVVTNPLYGSNFEETIKKLPPSTIDRILIWKQTQQHYKWVRSGDNKFEVTPSIKKNEFLAVYDYMNGFMCDFDNKKVKLIIQEIKPKCPNYMLNLYETRYGHHHSVCLLDGIIKTRCLFSQDSSFLAKDEDYETFKKLWEDLVLGWYDKISKSEGERLLSEQQKALFEMIKVQEELWDYNLEKLCLEKNFEYKNNYKRLLELKMIEVNNRKITIIEEEEIGFEDLNL